MWTGNKDTLMITFDAGLFVNNRVTNARVLRFEKTWIQHKHPFPADYVVKGHTPQPIPPLRLGAFLERLSNLL
jgi:hypothetical protein